MAFPTVQGRATDTSASGTSHTHDLPPGVQAGELLIVIATAQTNGITFGTPSGWNQLSNAFGAHTIFWKIAAGNETTITWTTNTAQLGISQSWRIANHDGNGPAEAIATGSGDPNPPNLNLGSAADRLWIAWCGWISSSANVSAYPTNYSNGAQVNIGTTVRVAAAERLLNAAAENPGIFDLTAGANHVTSTIAVTGASAATVEASAALTATGEMTADGSQVASGAAALEGSGQTAANGQQTASAAIALTATGQLAADGRQTAAGAAELAGTGSLTGSAARTAHAAAVLAGAGALHAAGALTALAACELTGTGALAAEARQLAAAQAALTASGDLNAAAANIALAAAALAGAGALAATGNVEGIITAAAVLTGTGALTADALGTVLARAALTGDGALLAAAHQLAHAAALLTGIGALLVAVEGAEAEPPTTRRTRASLGLSATLAGVAPGRTRARTGTGVTNAG